MHLLPDQGALALAADLRSVGWAAGMHPVSFNSYIYTNAPIYSEWSVAIAGIEKDHKY